MRTIQADRVRDRDSSRVNFPQQQHSFILVVSSRLLRAFFKKKEKKNVVTFIWGQKLAGNGKTKAER